ncbi:MAG: hypothetical protein KatS3mg131_3723 [Candidatus Tectimicrobiota bacterium]|nr:MAG: hypothetical protein KatS3mg131_3723 [Candidatus Tectomicrobia bacterium]
MQPDETVDAIEFFYEQGWTDGLPVVPPTVERVRAMIERSGRAASEVIAELPPRGGKATVEKIATNAVMAGCLPEYMPVILTALEALMDPRFNLNGVLCSTHMATPLLILNGPIVKELQVNCGHNLFGPGWRANATIGRAVQLILVNIGGAIPGVVDKATFGHPGKYTYCIAENEAANPWEPLHVSRGFQADDSTVTVYAAEAPHNVNNHGSDNARDLLTVIADCLSTLGSNHLYVGGECFLILSPEHAATIAASGWKKRDVQAFLYEHARQPVRLLRLGGMYGADTQRNLWPRWVDHHNPDALVPPTRHPEDIVVLVAGGAGKHSVVLPGWGSRSVTRKIVS